MPRKPTKPRTARRLILEIDDCQAAYEVRATNDPATPVKEAGYLVLHATPNEPVDKVDDTYFYLNIVTRDRPPHERLGGSMVGRILFTKEFAKGYLYLRPELHWHIFAAVKSNHITHIALFLQPTEDPNEDVIIGYDLAAQEEPDVFSVQFEPE